MIAPDELDRDPGQLGEFGLGHVNRPERPFLRLRLHGVGEDVTRVLVSDDALDVVALEPGQQSAEAAGRVGQQHRGTDAVHRLGRRVGFELRVPDGIELIIARAVGLFERGGIVHRELLAGPELAVLGSEAPGAEVALVASGLGLVGVILATPVGPAHARPIPDVCRIAGAQQLGLIALAPIPPPLPHRRAGAVPQEQRRALGIDRDLVFDMAMVADQRLGGRIAEHLAAGLERALPRDGDGPVGQGRPCRRADRRKREARQGHSEPGQPSRA